MPSACAQVSHKLRESHEIGAGSFGLDHGQVFVDVAVINGEIHGYELKSERDTLERLPRQVEVYSAVLGRATLVVGASYEVFDTLPGA
jgi:hypothetical protein